MSKVKVKKQNKECTAEQLKQLSKEELIEKVKTLVAHNTQLKNLLAKNVTDGHKSEGKRPNQFDFSRYTVRHVLLKFFYLGWDYQGYVVQEDTANTIEHHLFEALLKTRLIKDRPLSNYHRCGRTDKGVSSFEQVISIDLRSKLTKDSLTCLEDELDYCKMLNSTLPDNIQCVAWCPVEDSFSARFDCKGRTYKYFFPKGNLNVEKMQDASNRLVGTHDFRNLCKMDVGNGVVEFTRNIASVDVELFDSSEDVNEFSMYVITIKGQAFLWHQIRCIMGVLFLIGEEKERPEVIEELLDIKANPRKPEYAMASEIPLNLYHCEYDLNENWQWDKSTLLSVLQKLKSMWTFSNIKTTMIRSMLNDLETVNGREEHSQIHTTCLLLGVKAKKYIPLMKRQKCESLEGKINHFMKRSRLEIEKD